MSDGAEIMQEQQIDWYAGGYSRAIRDQVTLERNGQIGVGFGLVHDWPAEHDYVRIGYDRARHVLVIMPCREGGRGRLKVQRFANDRRAARISARRAMVDMHLIPVKSCRYDASWEGAALVVSMGPTHEPIAASADLSHTSATSAASEVVFSLPPQVKDEPPATGHVPRRQDDDRPPRCCGNCTWQKFRLCTCQSSPNANTLIGLDDVCDVHFYSLFLRRAGEKDPRPQIESHTLPPGKSRTPIQTARNLTKQTPRDRNRSRPLAQGSRQRALCPHDDHGGKLFPVSSRGIQPHDADGVVYSADRGDRDRRCPGSNQLPKS